MFPICKSNNNIFFLYAKMMTRPDITITDFYSNGIRYVHSNVSKVSTVNDLRDTGNLS